MAGRRVSHETERRIEARRQAPAPGPGEVPCAPAPRDVVLHVAPETTMTFTMSGDRAADVEALAQHLLPLVAVEELPIGIVFSLDITGEVELRRLAVADVGTDPAAWHRWRGPLSRGVAREVVERLRE